MTLLLADASDPSSPVLKDVIDIGGQGTESDACFRPQALHASLSADGRSLLLALPIQLHGVSDPSAEPASGDSEQVSGWIHTGLYLFDVCLAAEENGGGRPGFVEPGILAAERAADAPAPYWVLDQGTDRILVRGSAVHYVHRGRVWSAPLDSPTEAVGPR